MRDIEPKDTYTREDLLDAWLRHEQSRASHPDVADYYYRRAWAFAVAFESWGPGMALKRVQPELHQLWTLFNNVVRSYNSIHAPWGYFLTGRPEPARAEVEATHAPRIAAACDGLRSAYRALMLDLMERIWNIGPERTVSLDQIREHGFDPSAPAPELARYL